MSVEAESLMELIARLTGGMLRLQAAMAEENANHGIENTQKKHKVGTNLPFFVRFLQ